MKKMVEKILATEKMFKPLFIFLLFSPIFFHGPRFGVPYVKGGDEPHYLIILNSFLMDGDLDVKNNYDSAREGSWQAGKKFAGEALDHQTEWFVDGKQLIWSKVYDETNKWKKDARGVYIPERRPGVTLDVSRVPEYPGHPPGIAFLLAPFLWPVRGTPYTEPLALFFSNLAVILSAFLFRRILKRYTQYPLAFNLGTVLTFLGLPLWAYGRTFFMEPFLLLFALGAFYFVLEKQSGFWAGIALGLGALLKPNFLILFFPLALFYLKNKNFKTILWLMVGPALSTAVILYLNYLMFASPFTPSIPFWFGNPLEGALGLLFSWNHGLFTLAPATLLAVVLWKKFIREHGAEALMILSGFLVYFLMMAAYGCWFGGWCFGPRLIVPVLPLLMVPIFYLPDAFSSWSKPIRWLALALCLLSLGFNLLGAMDGYWDSHPLTILKGNIS